MVSVGQIAITGEPVIVVSYSLIAATPPYSIV